ncbi:helix-turn-helix domain-containing protein [Arthrobacter woluwensis]|uniref:Transcriptional regulator, contains XRE-family HTH domain n=1 Tax=Arthrobacter woluwensis TaxID=156980 RepID=A0A1H4SZQ7_9MICC|nr:XRE family transcriptional regulator [Arthrobacter woluwensis]SEC49662.1 Transcriptional regulator, contains XRE-family HTH domain [Arthrobacter woluwensis]
MASPQDSHDSELNSLLAGVGPRLRAIREARNLTLGELSGLTGTSVSTLSRLESGGRKPTLELLYPLARAYRVPLDELVGAPAVGDPRVHIKPISKYGQTLLPLSRGDSGMRAYKHVLHGKSMPEEPQPKVHPGHEWLYVLAGELRLVLGSQEYRLGPGEAAEFDTTTPHWFGAAGPVATEFLGIFSPAGEKVHVSEF